MAGRKSHAERIFVGEPSADGRRVVAEVRRRRWGDEIVLAAERLVNGQWKRWGATSVPVGEFSEIARRVGSRRALDLDRLGVVPW